MKPKTYHEAYAAFDLNRALAALASNDASGVNAAVVCCDRHCGENRTAFTCVSRDGTTATYSFERFRELSSRFANVLRTLGVKPGDRVAGLLPRTPELLVTVLGAWRAGAIYQPLFTAFGPKAIEHRLQTSQAKIVVTDIANRPKLTEVTTTAQIVTVSRDKAVISNGDLDFFGALGEQSVEFQTVARELSDPFLMMFTSGTTGAAKPLYVPLKAIAAFMGYMRDAVDLQPSDRFWNMADPGWGYGLYGVVGPLAMGLSTLFYDGPFSVESTVRTIKEQQITSLAGAPTGFRLLMAAGPEALRDIKGRLRVVSSAGEPLNPEVIRWFATHLETTIHDHYGQTELGMVVCNHHALEHPVHAGAAGYSVPGHRMVIVDDKGNELPPGCPGQLALDHTRSPLFWFSGYEGQSAKSLHERYYLTGDTAELNADGTISFIGRSDDVITSAGYRIGPFDVESALLEHSAVAESAVIGKPDAERTEIVKAFVVLRQGHQGSERLAEELQRHVRHRLSAHAYPREVEFVESLPKTPSGKIQRFVLRSQEVAKLGARST